MLLKGNFERVLFRLAFFLCALWALLVASEILLELNHLTSRLIFLEKIHYEGVSGWCNFSELSDEPDCPPIYQISLLKTSFWFFMPILFFSIFIAGSCWVFRGFQDKQK